MPSSNPPYNYALGAANQSGIPPFDLSKVVMRVFPLRANYHSLQLFCNRYINIAPEYSHVEPAAPFVLFCVINYGHMGNVSSNLGYTSQNEVLFSVPLNWYRKQGGKWALQKNSSISPFIWVDEPSSAWTGRDVFGWPKSIAWLKSGVNEWAKDPTAPRTLFSLEALMYERMFAAERQRPAVLLDIDQVQPSAVLQVPPDPMNALNPWLSWPKGVLRALGGGGTLLEAMTRLPTFGFPPWGNGASGAGANIGEMMKSMFGDYNPIRSLPASNTINLKQFRHPSYPQSISYQAIINSKMTPKSFSRGGMLGESGLLRGDLAGGYRLRVHRNPAWPIIESLGLQVSQEYEEQGRNVAVLEPVLPFWVDVDFEYGQGEVICWRTYDSHWKAPAIAGEEPDPADTKAEAEVLEEEVIEEEGGEGCESEQREVEQLAFMCNDCESPHLYNTAEGSAVEQVYGPFTFPDATVRVLPLIADWDKLRKFTDEYLNFPLPDTRTTAVDADGNLLVVADPEREKGSKESKAARGARRDFLRESKMLDSPLTEKTPSGNLFVPWGRYVYMTVTSYEEITSELNVGWWAQRRVTFSYPVKWYKWVDDREVEGELVEPHWELKSFGVVSPFMYVDTPTAATVGREMNGWCVAEADIECPRTDWLFEAEGSNAVNLMTLSTNVVPALNANQKTQQGLLLEVTTRDPAHVQDTEAWEEIAALWGERQVLEAMAKAKEARPKSEPGEDKGWPPQRRLTWLKSTAMELLFRNVPINHIALKQFRDAKNPNQACLQAINVYPESVSRVHDLRPIDETLHVGVHRYPTAPIVDLLGLDVKWTDNSAGQPVQYLQAIRPFWMRADLKAELGRDVASRAGSPEWRDGENAGDLYFDCSKQAAAPVLAARFADEHPQQVQDFGSERIFRDSVRRMKETFKEHEWAITRGGHWDLLRDSRVDFSPQIAIESILTRRWVNFDPDLLDFDPQDPALWHTLIPQGSIRGHAARAGFFKHYEHLLALIERAYDRLVDSKKTGATNEQLKMITEQLADSLNDYDKGLVDDIRELLVGRWETMTMDELRPIAEALLERWAEEDTLRVLHRDGSSYWSVHPEDLVSPTPAPSARPTPKKTRMPTSKRGASSSGGEGDVGPVQAGLKDAKSKKSEAVVLDAIEEMSAKMKKKRKLHEKD